MEARKPFDVAWDALTDPVLEVLQRPDTDSAAVMTTLLRFAIQIHMGETHTVGTDAAKEMFLAIAAKSYEQTVTDARRELKMDRGTS